METNFKNNSEQELIKLPLCLIHTHGRHLQRIYTNFLLSSFLRKMWLEDESMVRSSSKLYMHVSSGVSLTGEGQRKCGFHPDAHFDEGAG